MLVYVSGPYTGAVSANIAAARDVASKLWEQGHVVICPHTNTAHFESFCNATYEQYIDGDLILVSVCDAIVMLPGWEHSKGAIIEKIHAEMLNIPVYYAPLDHLPMPKLEVDNPEYIREMRAELNKIYRSMLYSTK